MLLCFTEPHQCTFKQTRALSSFALSYTLWQRFRMERYEHILKRCKEPNKIAFFSQSYCINNRKASSKLYLNFGSPEFEWTWHDCSQYCCILYVCPASCLFCLVRNLNVGMSQYQKTEVNSSDRHGLSSTWTVFVINYLRSSPTYIMVGTLAKNIDIPVLPKILNTHAHQESFLCT